ncbi:hypothetical protein [Alteraurantiacibacter aquimixticola]|uniref:Uncharacterized protein n=1 Tax=Alteraurantiacibacter aquimixticola TaxID=2489173 RepID=A0A4T3F039_9SPHN|nr:hypothetical protein [Alteraurantiacibacter aquimixticola]TIX49542.1 hypothetical protein E5222_11905 [Alteraurantiacibacter aquimixticola]
MSNDLTRQSERLIEEGRSLVRDNQHGGRHRREGIAEGSRRLRRQHFGKKLKSIALAVVGILVAASVAGVIIDGIGFVGVMVTFFAILAAVGFFSSRKIKIPQRADLTRTQDARQLVARTELWLEAQRPALPPPAVKLVEDIGVQLDGLGVQLEHVDPAHPAAGETRKLVGEVLPEMIDSYRKIPQHLRREQRAGSTPDAQLVDSLGKISKEIDHVTRQLAEGSLDDLAIRTRYLDYRYGGADGLPPPEKSQENN